MEKESLSELLLRATSDKVAAGLTRGGRIVEPAKGDEMGEARDIMDRVTEAVFDKDWEALKALYAADAVAETPDQGTIGERDGIVEYLAEFLTAFPDGSYESAHQHESEAHAIDEGYFVGTHTGPLTGPTGEVIEGTGKRVRARVCDIATVEGGLVTSHRFYFDNMDFLEQLGLLPEPEA